MSRRAKKKSKHKARGRLQKRRGKRKQGARHVDVPAFAQPDADQIQAEIDEHVSRLIESISETDPVNLASAVAYKIAFSDEDPDSDLVQFDPPIEESIAALEYIIGLIACNGGCEKKNPVTDTVVESVMSEAGCILTKNMMYFLADSSSRDANIEAYARYSSASQHLLMRGEALKTEYVNYAREMYSLSNEWFERNFNQSAPEFIDGYVALIDELQQNCDVFMRAGTTLRDNWAAWKESDVSLEDYEMDEDMRSALRQFNINMFDVTEHVGFLQKTDGTMALVLELGDNKEIIGPEHHKYWPTNNNALRKTPLLRIDGRVYLFMPQTLIYGLIEAIDELICGNDQEYYNKKHTKRRDKHIERIVVDAVRSLKGDGISIYNSVFYNVLEDNVDKRVESDVLLVMGSVIVVFEVKAGKLSDSAKRGSVDRLKKNLKQLVGKASKQGARLCSKLADGEEVELYDSKKRLIRKIDGKSIREAYCVCVTQRSLGTLGVNYQNFREIAGDKEKQMSIVVNHFDLSAILAILDNPEELTLYLRRRIEAAIDGRTHAADEIDMLGMFLQQGLYVESDRFKSAGFITIANHGHEIWKWYEKRKILNDPEASKPKLSIEEEYRQLMRGIVESRHIDATWVASSLLEHDEYSRKELMKGLRKICKQTEVDGTGHHLIFVTTNKKLFLLFFVRGREDRDNGIPKKFDYYMVYRPRELGAKNAVALEIRFKGTECRTINCLGMWGKQ